MGAEQTKVTGYRPLIDKAPRIAAIVFLVLNTLLLIAILLQVAITRDWTVSTTQPTDRNANADWGLLLLSGWLSAGLLNMIMCPGSKLGFGMTMAMAIVVMVFAVIADITSWGRYIDCRDNTIPGDTDFCDQNHHGDNGLEKVGFKNLILSSAILQLILVLFALIILIIAAVWYNKRKEANGFGREISGPVQFAPPPQNLVQQYSTKQQQQQQYPPIQAVPQQQQQQQYYYQQQPQSQRFAPPIHSNYSLVHKTR